MVRAAFLQWMEPVDAILSMPFWAIRNCSLMLSRAGFLSVRVVSSDFIRFFILVFLDLFLSLCFSLCRILLRADLWLAKRYLLYIFLVSLIFFFSKIDSLL